MKRVVYLFLSIIVVFSVACCGGSGGSKTVLAGIDTLADSRPDSALRLLAGMKRSMASASEAERNYYRLLLVKARDKAYIRHTSDSVILSLVDYYEHDGDKRLLPVAYYYAGRVYRDLNDAVKALKYFQKAENALAETGGSYSFEDKLHSQKGYLLIRQDLYAAALREFDKAYKYTVERKDTNGIFFVCVTRAKCILQLSNMKRLWNIIIRHWRLRKSLIIRIWWLKCPCRKLTSI